MDNYREFWILINRCALPDRVCTNEHQMLDLLEPNDNKFHVIDYEAYKWQRDSADQAHAMVDQLLYELDTLKSKTN